VEHVSGICRVAPPPEWVAGVAEAFAIDRASLKFNARVQRVDQLQRKHTAVASQRFWNEYQAWMAANGVKRKGGKLNPVFGGKEIELDRLHAIVQRRGGYEAVTGDRGWREVANILDVSARAAGVDFGNMRGLGCLCYVVVLGVGECGYECGGHEHQRFPACFTCQHARLASDSSQRAMPPSRCANCSRSSCCAAPLAHVSSHFLLLTAAGRQVGQRRLLPAQAVREAAAPL